MLAKRIFIHTNEWKRAIGFLEGRCQMHIKPHTIEITPFKSHEWQTGIPDQNEESRGLTVRFWCSSETERVYKAELSLLRNFFRNAQSDTATITLNDDSIDFAVPFGKEMQYGVVQTIKAERIT